MSFIEKINFFLSDYILTLLLLFVGMFFTFKTGFVQLRCFPQALKNIFSDASRKNKGVSPFQALTTAVGAQVGTGNIIGVCGAILIGGPGAIFWIWVSAFLGMATIYAEAVLAQKTKTYSPSGKITGGPVYYIKKAYKGRLGKAVSSFFAIAVILALGFIGTSVQTNAISSTLSSAFSLPPPIIGIILTCGCAFAFTGDAKRIGKITEKLVPFMTALYLLGCGIILICNFSYLPRAFRMIFRYAFKPYAFLGGSIGYAIKTSISQGIKRGLFSNEAGMGSTPHAHAMANALSSHNQGLMAILGVFIDTFLVLSTTALTIITVLYTKGNLPADTPKEELLALALSSVYPKNLCGGFIAISLFFFAFSSVISWNYFGKVNFIFLFGEKRLWIYTALSLVFVFFGTVLSGGMLWELSDMMNQLMVIPNVMALLSLSGEVKNAIHESEKKIKFT